MADQDDPSTLADPLHGLAGLFVMTTYDAQGGGTEGEVRRGRAIAKAARAGVPHVVYSSVGGADRDSGVPHFESKRRVEEALNDLVPSVFVRPTFFMENLARALAPSDSEEFALPMPGDVPIQMVAVATSEWSPPPLSATPSFAGEHRDRRRRGHRDRRRRRRRDELGKPGIDSRRLPLSALGGDADRRAMFEWFVNTPAYAADFDGRADRSRGPGPAGSGSGWLTRRRFDDVPNSARALDAMLREAPLDLGASSNRSAPSLLR